MVASNLIVKILTKDEANASSDHDGGEPSAASRVCDERPGKIAGPPLTPLPAQELGGRKMQRSQECEDWCAPKKTKTTREKLLQQPGIVRDGRVSSAGEFHPRALSEPDVSLSAHTAPAVVVTRRVVTSSGLASLVGSSHCWLTRRVRLYNITPSWPGESHPEPLTDPDLNLSIHPARATS